MTSQEMAGFAAMPQSNLEFASFNDGWSSSPPPPPPSGAPPPFMPPPGSGEPPPPPMFGSPSSSSSPPSIQMASMQQQLATLQLQMAMQQQNEQQQFSSSSQQNQPLMTMDGSPVRAKDSFSVTAHTHFIILAIMLAGFIVGLVGFIGMLIESIRPPAIYIMMGVGFGMSMIAGMIGGGGFRIVTFSRRSGQESMHIRAWSISLVPPIIGVHSWTTEHAIDEMTYENYHWTTTSRDKNGNTHTHQHDWLVIDGVGVGDLKDQVSELNTALGRHPTARYGKPDGDSVCCCCVCGCTCA